MIPVSTGSSSLPLLLLLLDVRDDLDEDAEVRLVLGLSRSVSVGEAMLSDGGARTTRVGDAAHTDSTQERVNRSKERLWIASPRILVWLSRD